MLNPRALAAAVVATGAGAVIFLSTGQDPASPAPRAPFEPVPVALPPTATEVPEATHPAIPAVRRDTPPSTAAPVPSAVPKPAATTSPVTSASRPAPVRPPAKPKRAAARQALVTTQQPQPSGTEPNGTGGWQLPACSDDSCVAPQASAAKPPTLIVITAPILGLIGSL